MSTNSGSRRLERLLRLIPLLQRNSGVSISDVSSLFSLTETELISDLNLIWVCGLPGYSHLELIDVSYDDGNITIQNAETISRPLRLTFEEGVSLLLAIDNVMSIVPASDAGILHQLHKKLLSLINMEEQETLDPDNQTAKELIVPTILKALHNEDFALDSIYYSATLDTVLHDVIIPREFFSRSTFTYLKAYSISEKSYRVFRLDRFESVGLVQRSEVDSIDISRDADSSAPLQGLEVELEISSEAYWLIQRWGLDDFTFDQRNAAFTGKLALYSKDWLVRAALSSGGALIVRHPQEVRIAVLAAAKRALANYEKPLK